MTAAGLLGRPLHALRGSHVDEVVQGFVKHDALQCGFCTPGMVMNAVDLVRGNAAPTEA